VFIVTYDASLWAAPTIVGGLLCITGAYAGRLTGLSHHREAPVR